jgi:hypothetical protein
VGGGIILLGLIAWGCIALEESIDHEDTSNARNVGLGFTITGLSVMAVGVVVGIYNTTHIDRHDDAHARDQRLLDALSGTFRF